MLDIRFVRENPEAVKENIRKKFQDAKLPLVDEVIKLDAEYRAAIGEASDLRATRSSSWMPSTALPSARPATCAPTATSCPSRSVL